MADSIYKRVSAVESFIPQLDAAQTENAQALLRMIGTVANAHNELIHRLKEQGADKFDDLLIDISKTLNDPALGS